MPAAMRQPHSAVWRRRAEALVASCSIEISPRDELARDGLGELFNPGTTVFVNHPGSVTHHDIIAACAKLRRAGFNPVPHIAARRLASFTQASDFVQRAAAEAAVTSALVIGGDPDHAMGPFPDARDLLSSGLLARNGLRAVLFAGYPEGHPRISARFLDEALRAKLAVARSQGLEASVVTQFSFDARPILDWLAALKAREIACPVRVGIAGPATVATLAKFAVRCGIGASLRALARGHTAFARILAEARPDALIEALAAGEDPRWPINGLHIFTFGGVRRTAEWISGYLQFKTSAAR